MNRYVRGSFSRGLAKSKPQWERAFGELHARNRRANSFARVRAESLRLSRGFSGTVRGGICKRNRCIDAANNADHMQQVRAEIGRRLRGYYDAGARPMPNRLAELPFFGELSIAPGAFEKFSFFGGVGNPFHGSHSS